ncbi:hypothetical protein GDO86_018127, partial [Hymenochirus boettgeri]
NPEESADEDQEKDEDSEDSSSSDDDNEEGMSASKFLKKAESAPPDTRSKFLKKEEVEEDEESSDDEDWGSESDESDSDESEEEGKYTSIASRFLKKKSEEVDRQAADKKKEEKAKKKQHRKVKRKDEEGEEEEEENEAGGEWEKVKGGVPLVKEKPKMFAKGTEITPALVIKKLTEILQARGKKGTDRAAQIDLLQLLVGIAEEHNLGQGITVKIKFNIVSSLYDYNPNLAAYMKADMWKKCLQCIGDLLDILFANSNIFIGEHIAEDSENLINLDQPLRVRGCILTLVERMDEEFTKIMQNTDPHSQEYVDNLKDEARVCGVIERVQKYLQEKGSTDEICRVYLRRIMHTYYKFDYKAHQRQLGTGQESKSEQDQTENEAEDSAILMDRLCKYIYSKDRTDRIRTCAILCHIYHHALHNRWFQARDLMLMSHLQDNIQHADPPVQVTISGICAFRQGMIRDAHNALLDIQSTRTGRHEFNARRRMISKQFHHQLRVGERQPLLGPPESMREHVVAASKAMKMGDWKTCRNFIINEKMNAKVWDLFPEAERVRNMLKDTEESLRTYLFTYSSVYDSIRMGILSDMFQLEIPTVHSIISKMIINEELMASLDQPTQTVVMHGTEPSSLQNTALQLAEKLGTLVENNERIFDHKQGSYGGYFNRGEKDKKSPIGMWNVLLPPNAVNHQQG